MRTRTQYSSPTKCPIAPRLIAPLTICLALPLASITPPVSAQIYRWVDADGVTVYSQQAPPEGPATPIKTPPNPSAQDQARALERVNKFTERDFDQRQESAQKAEEANKQAKEKAARQANCQAARKNLETIETLGARRLHTPDGQYRYLSDDERARYQAESRKLIQENCQ